MSLYLVLRKVLASDGSPAWTPVRERVQAPSARIAVREALAGLSAEEVAGTYVACPERSFREIEVSLEREPRLRLESVSRHPRLVEAARARAAV